MPLIRQGGGAQLRRPTLTGHAALLLLVVMVGAGLLFRTCPLSTTSLTHTVDRGFISTRREQEVLGPSKLDAPKHEQQVHDTTHRSKLAGPPPAAEGAKAAPTVLQQPPKVLALMNVKVKSERQIEEELRWIQEDNLALCSHSNTCRWIVNVVVTKKALHKPFEEASSALPSNVMVHATVSSSYFNKFSFIKRHLGDLLNYDLILFKDNDQRIAGFSWPTFVEKSSNAVMAGPMRRTVKSSCGSSPQIQISEACHYEKDDWPKWSSIMYHDVVPLEVPWLEMFFVVMDAKFANFLFSLLLRDTLVNNASSWGPDICWCQAAKAWGDGRPGCYMVPVVSKHEHTKQIVKNGAHWAGGHEAIKAFQDDTILGNWTIASSTWRRIAQGRNLAMIEQSCRRLLRLGENDAFDVKHLHRCSAKSVTPIPSIHHTLRQLVQKLQEGKNSVDDTSLLTNAKMRLEEHIRDVGIKEKRTSRS